MASSVCDVAALAVPILGDGKCMSQTCIDEMKLGVWCRDQAAGLVGKEHPPPLPLTRELGDWIWRSEDPATWVVVVPVVVSAMISTGFGATQNAIVSAMRCFPSKKAAHGDDLIFREPGKA